MKAAVFYYTQSGQALDVAHSICSPLEASKDDCVIYKEIIPIEKYPFPWTKDLFFDTFPETRLGMPPSGIHAIALDDVADADLVIIVGQSWYLSPSLPIQSFLLDESIVEYLRGRDVVFVNACRNMWLMTSRIIKKQLHHIGAHLIGHIVLHDKANNLVGVLTVIRWLMYGRKERSGLLPAAGVADEDITDASRFGEIIMKDVKEGNQNNLQRHLLEAGAIDYAPSVIYIEKVGYRIFGVWAKLIRRRGGWRDSRRMFLVNMFYIYLLVVLFLVSPFAQLFFWLTYPLHRVKKNREIDCNV